MAINFPIFVPATVHAYFKEQKDLIPTLEREQEYHTNQKETGFLTSNAGSVVDPSSPSQIQQGAPNIKSQRN